MQRPSPSSPVHDSVSSATLEDTVERKRLQEEYDQLPRPEKACCEKAQAFAKRAFSLYESEHKARSKAEELNRTKDEFLAAVSHELRTPLTAILGWTQVLRGGKLDESTYVRGLQTLERSAHAQEQLIEDLLDVMRMKRGKLRLHKEPIELSSIVDSAIDTLQPLADSKQIRVERITSSKTACVLGDRARLQQVMWNLLSNAIKFTPRGGCVLVQVGRVDSHMEVQVHDTGEGIRPDFLPHIFEPYRQPEENGTTRDQGLGLGLGLAIVRDLVELHGGTVRAESSGKGRGSCFTVRLPLMANERASQAVDETITTNKCGSSSQPMTSVSASSKINPRPVSPRLRVGAEMA